MGTLFSDTDPATERFLIEKMRALPAWRKLQMVDEMNKSVRLLMLAGLRKRYPHAGEAELRRRLAERLLGGELAEKVLSDSAERE